MKGNIFNWFYRFFLVLLPFIYFNSLIDPVLIPRQLYLSIFLFIIIILLILKNIAGYNCNFSYLKNKGIYAFLLFLILNFTSIFFANTLSEAYYVCSKTGILFVFLIITIHLIYNHHLQIKAISETAIIISFIFIFYGIYQIITQYFSGLSIIDNYKITSLNANKNLFSSCLLLLLSFSFWGLTKKRIWKVVAATSVLLTFFLIIILQTRAVFLGTFIAIITCFTIYVFFNKNQLQQRFTFISFIKKKSIFFLFILITITISYYIFTKLAFMLESDSIHTRLVMWKKTIMMIIDHPWGVGAGNWQVFFPFYVLDNMNYKIITGLTTFQRPHNDFLWIAAETGIAGIIAYLGIFLFAFSSLIKKIKNSLNSNEFWLYLFIFSGLAGYIMISFFDFPYERIEHQILLMLLIAIAFSNYSTRIKVNHINKKIFLFYLFPVLFSIIVCINRVSGEKHTRAVIDAHHKEDWLKVKSEGEKAINVFYMMDPMSTPIYWYIGVADFSMNNIKAAKDNFLKAYSIHPNHIHVLNNLASCCDKTKNYSDAIKYYLKALEISPAFLEARLNLSGSYFNSGDYENAFKEINLYPYNSFNQKYITFRDAILKAKMDIIIKKELNNSVKEKLFKIKNDHELLLKYFKDSKDANTSFEDFLIINNK